MKYLKGNGLPYSGLQASIGDIYTDISTREQYECVFAYGCSNSSSIKCNTSWRRLDSLATDVPQVEVEKKPEEKKPVVENKSDKKETQPSHNTNYSKYSKGNTR